MEKLKIAFFVPSFPNVTETFVINQIIDLINRGHCVYIFAFSNPQLGVIHDSVRKYNLLERTSYLQEGRTPLLARYVSFLKFLLKNGNNITFRKLLKMFNYFKYKKKAFSLRYYTKYQWIFKKGDFDIFHAHFGDAGKYVSELKSFGYFPKTSFVTSFHGYDIIPDKLMDYKLIYKHLFQEVDLLTVNTLYLYELLMGLSPQKPIEILPVGLDTTKFKKEKRKKNEKFTLLFVGRLVEFKAPNLAIEIIKTLANRGYQGLQIVIVGEGEMKEQLLTTIQTTHLEDYVKMKGALKQNAVRKYMDRADILLMPGIHDKTGRSETQGLIIQEAQAMELPVIVSDAGGMKYGLIDGMTGFVVKEGDIGGFAEKVEILLKDEDLRIKMGKKGREFVVNNYDSKLLGTQLENLYYSTSLKRRKKLK